VALAQPHAVLLDAHMRGSNLLFNLLIRHRNCGDRDLKMAGREALQSSGSEAEKDTAYEYLCRLEEAKK